MTNDPLKDLLMADPVAAVPAQDLTFVVEVMKRAEQRRLLEGLAWLTLTFLCVTTVLFVVMPHLTPVLADVGKSLQPVAVVLALVGVLFVALDQSQRYFRAYGFGL